MSDENIDLSLDLGEEFEIALDIDLDNLLSFDHLEFEEDEENRLIATLPIMPLDGGTPVYMLVVKHPRTEEHINHRYSVGEMVTVRVDETGDDISDLRHTSLLMQQYDICPDTPIEDNRKMFGPMSYVRALKIPKLIQATMFGNEELRQQCVYDIKVFNGLLDRDPIKETTAEIHYPVFGKK